MIRKVKLKLVNHYSLTASFDALSKTSLVLLICFPEENKKKRQQACLIIVTLQTMIQSSASMGRKPFPAKSSTKRYSCLKQESRKDV